MRIREKLKPEKKHPQFAITCNNLGNIYRDLGQFEKSESLYLQAKEIRAEFEPLREHPFYAGSCNILADLYSYMNEYAKAEQLYIEAKNINSKNDDRKAYAQSCNNLAILYLDKGEFKKAETLAQEAQENFKVILTPGDPDIAISLNTLGDIYFAMKDFDKAKKYFNEATDLWQKELGKEHPYYQQGLSNLAKTYWNKNDHVKTTELYNETFSLQSRQISKIFRFTSEREKQQYLENAIINTDEIYSYYSGSAIKDNGGYSYSIALAYRNLTLSSATQMKQAVNNSNNLTLITRYNEWTDLKQQLAKLYTKKPTASLAQINETEEKANVIEKELLKSSFLSS
jgi:tetratricopeptide (TPR) repeat protein